MRERWGVRPGGLVAIGCEPRGVTCFSAPPASRALGRGDRLASLRGLGLASTSACSVWPESLAPPRGFPWGLLKVCPAVPIAPPPSDVSSLQGSRVGSTTEPATTHRWPIERPYSVAPPRAAVPSHRVSVSALLRAGAVRLVSSGVRVWVCTALAVLSFKLVPESEAQSQSRPVRGACRSWAPGRGPQRVLASSGGRSCSFISPRLASLWGDGCPLQQGWSRSSRRCWALGVGSP